MSSFRAYFTKNIRADNVVRGTPDTASEWVAGDLVFYDTATNTWKQCGANPALIGALAEADASSSTLDPDGKVPLRLIQSDDIICMSSATDWTQSTVGDTVDIEDSASGKWRVLATTGNARVTIRDGVAAAESLDGALYYVQFIGANLQFDAVAS
jgi:hypothetical protein